MSMKGKISILVTAVMVAALMQIAVFGAPSVVGVSDSVVENAPGEALLFSSGYVEIDIGARQSETNVRFAEINGVQKAITENNNKYFVDLGDSDLLVEITEKTSADASSVVSTQYFYIDKANKTYRKLDMDTYMQSYEEKAIRTVGEKGIRFKAHALTDAKYEETQFIIDEYGYLVTTKDALGSEELTLNSSKYVRGVGFNRANGINIVFDSTNDDYDVFTLVLKNIPVKNYKTDVVCKTYTKLKVQGKSFVLYGEPMVGNAFDIAAGHFAADHTNMDIAKMIFDYVSYEGANSSFEGGFVTTKTENSSVAVSGSFTNTDSVGEKYNVYLVTYNQYGTVKNVKKSDSFTVVSGFNSFSTTFDLSSDENQAEAFVLTSDLRLVAEDNNINWQITESSFYNTLSSNAFTSATDFSQYFDPDDNVSVIEAITLLSHLHAKYNGTEVKERDGVTYEHTLEMDDAEVFVDLSERNSVNLTGISFSRATGSIDEENSYLYGQTSDDNEDPQVVINGLNLDARKYNKITLRMKLEQVEGGTASLGSKSLQLFFKTNSDTGITEQKSFSYSYKNVSNVYDWFEIELDLTNKGIWKISTATETNPVTTGELWQDVITGIRVDPFNANGKFYIDYITFSQGDTTEDPNWHDVYLDYAIDNNIIKLGEYFTSEFDREITREEFFLMLISAFPESEFAIINNISALPDIEKNEKYAELYLLMYNSGITLGFDEDGNMGLSSPITRSQFAGIANRLLVPANRLKGTVEASWDSDAYKHDVEFNDKADESIFSIRTNTTESATVENGSLVLVSKAAGDSGMAVDGLSINADVYTKVKVRIKVDEAIPADDKSGRTAEIYFKPDDYVDPITNYHPTFVVTDYYLDPLGWYVFEFDLALHQEWNGTVSYFRFDPMNAARTYTIDYIRFIKSPYTDLPDQESLVANGYVGTDIMPDGFKNGYLVSTGSNGDTFAEMNAAGKIVTFPETESESKPLWTLGCWYNGAGTEDFPVIDVWEDRDTTTDEYTFADTYGINTVTYNPELDSMSMRLNATKIYNGKPHDANVYSWWPHQLFDINQNFASTIDKEVCSADADRMFVEIDIRMEDFVNTPYLVNTEENMNVCGYLAYFYLRVKEQPSHKIWFGFSLFSTKGDSNLTAPKTVRVGWGPDSAAHQYMYGIPQAVVYNGIENSFNPSVGVVDISEDDEWKHIVLDITPHIDRAVEWANRDNIFGFEVTKSDMYFAGLNIGYEIHGNYDATFEIKNIRMISYDKPE